MKLDIGYFGPVVLIAAFVSLPTLVIEDLDTISEVIPVEDLLRSFFLLCINLWHLGLLFAVESGILGLLHRDTLDASAL
ncbi:hypothetical protein [Edaphobacter dinghuensis]|uniref:hypothetical protein n=1 Tax=Edaphobacter dinghuensis TaxID=1560005 RepID=UPI001669ADC1|nr:hypothetical protein [Edaphobacter dinghuensis]